MKLLPVILCGGSGSRLWPLSREQDPKPFIVLDDFSLIQHAYQRANLVGDIGKIITVASRHLSFRAFSEFKKLGLPKCQNDYILEPKAKNTAPAIAIAALHAKQLYKDDNFALLILASDHLIKEDELFKSAVERAKQLAALNKIVTFGIKPNGVETGYGYIHYHNNEVKSFIEKPSYEKAASYVNSGDYLWNSGMFCFKPDVYLAELKRYRPDILSQVLETYAAIDQNDIRSDHSNQISLSEDLFDKVPEESVDYAVMEYSNNTAVVSCDFNWSDVGSWDSLAKSLTEQNRTCNAVMGDCEHILHDTNNSFLFSKDKMVVGIGLRNLVVVDTEDALLIADRNQSQKVKDIYQQLKQKNHNCYKIHKTAHRPWGTYTILDEGLGYKVKRIVVYPKQRLSLQHHHHRSEHWVVVQGIAEVVNGDENLKLSQNQSVYIKQGDIHRLVNIGQQPLVLIEVQCGNYLGEDDIVRHQDDYARQ